MKTRDEAIIALRQDSHVGFFYSPNRHWSGSDDVVPGLVSSDVARVTEVILSQFPVVDTAKNEPYRTFTMTVGNVRVEVSDINEDGLRQTYMNKDRNMYWDRLSIAETKEVAK